MAKKEPKPIETSSNEEEIIKYIEANKKMAEDNKRPDTTRMSQDYKLYESNPELRKHKWMSNRFIPVTFKTVETILSNIIGTLYSTNPPFDIKPREAGDKVQARIMKNVISYQFNYLNIYLSLVDFVKQCLIYGTAFAKIYWDRKIEPRTILEPEYIFGITSKPPFIEKKIKSYIPTRKDIAVTNNPTFEVVDGRDIFPSPDSVNIQDSWIIHRKYDLYGNLLARAQQEIYDIKRVRELKDVDIKYGEEKEYRHDDRKEEKTNELTHRVEILEFWGKVPLKWIDPSGSKEKFISAVITLAGRPGEYKLIRRQENPFWHGLNPFIKTTYIRKPKEFYGWGIPRVIGDLNLEINNIVNSRNDNMMLALQKVFIGVSGDVKKDQTIFPGAILIEEVQGALRDLNIGNITQDAYTEVFELERYSDESSGGMKVLYGAGAGQAKEMSQTATGMSITARAASARMMMYAKQIEFEAIREILQRFYQLNYQYLNPEDVVRIVGDREGRQYSPSAPEDVFKDYDFIPVGAFNMENKDFLVQNMIAYLKIAGNTPFVNMKELVKKIGIEGFNFPADDPIFPEEEEIQQNIQQMAQMQQAGVQGGEGRPMAKAQNAPAASMQTPANLAGGSVTKRIIK